MTRHPLERLAVLGVLAHALFLPISIAGMQIGLGVSIFALLGLRLAGRRVWAMSPLDLPALALAGAALASVGIAAAAGQPPVGWQEATLWRTMLSPLVILSVVELPRRPDGTPDAEASRQLALLVLAVWAAASLLPSGIAWLQRYTGFDPLHALGLRHEAIRAPAPRSPGHFAPVGFFRWYQRLAHNLTPPMCLAAALALHGRIAPRLRWLLGAASLAAAAAIVLTLSRAAWATLPIAALVLLVLRGGRWRRWALPAAAAAGLAMLSSPTIRARLPDNADRLTIWRVCAAVVKDHPLAGVGWGNLPRRSLPYYERIAPWYPLRAWCHDAFFSALAEGGPILLGALALYWVALFRAFFRWRRGDELSRTAAAGALAGLTAMLVNSLGHDILYSSETMYGLGFALAVAAALCRGSATPPAGARSAPA